MKPPVRDHETSTTDAGPSQSEDASPTAQPAEEKQPETKPTPKETPSNPIPPDAFLSGDHVELAKRMLSRYRYLNIDMVFSEGRFYRYESANGYWIEVPDHTLRKAVTDFSGKPLVGSGSSFPVLKIRETDVNGAYKVAASRAWKRDFFNQNATGLVFHNGFVAVREVELQLEPHSPGHRATFGVEHAYDPAARCRRFEAFLIDLFRDDVDAQDKIFFLQEFTGSCLLGLATKYQTCGVLVGEGSNGKSTLLDILAAQFPKQIRAAIPPQQWGDSYSLAQLPGIRLNAVSEIPEADIASSEKFKSIISGDPIRGRQIYSVPFEFRPVAGHIFSANTLPNLKDLSYGFWRRWCVIQFNRKFEGAERVVGLADQIIAEESQGITNWMMEGARRLLVQQRYTIPPSSDYAKDRWKHQCDTVAMFLEYRGYEDAGPWDTHRCDWTAAMEVYLDYKDWCKDHNHRPVASNKFSVRLKELGTEYNRTSSCGFYGIKKQLEPGSDKPYSLLTGPMMN